MTGRRICMETTLQDAGPQLSSNHYALSGGHRRGLWQEGPLHRLLPVSPPDAGVEMEEVEAQEGPEEEVNWWEEAALIPKVKKERGCDEGRTVEERGARRGGRGGGGVCFGVASSQGTWDLLHVSPSAAEHLP